MFDGIACFGGYLDSNDIAAKQMAEGKGTKVFIGHGKNDRQIPLTDGQRVQKMLEGYGYNVRMLTFQGGHEVDGATLNAGIIWLME